MSELCRTIPIDLGNSVRVGDGSFRIIAGPCAIRPPLETYLDTMIAVRNAGADMGRGGAGKWRSELYGKDRTKKFHGIRGEAIEYIREARRITGMPIFTEVTYVEDIQWAAREADVIQVGAKNVYNDEFLEAVGETGKTVLFKRGWDQNLDTYLQQIGVILGSQVQSGHTPSIILCERGIRSATGKESGAWTLDPQIIGRVKREYPYPIFGDATHSSLDPLQVLENMNVIAATSADGLMVEVDYDLHGPTDSHRVLTPEAFARMVPIVRRTHENAVLTQAVVREEHTRQLERRALRDRAIAAD